MGKKSSQSADTPYQEPTPVHTPFVAAYGQTQDTPPVYTPQQSATASAKTPTTAPMSDSEKYTRLGVGVTHGIASAVLGGLGGEGGKQGAEAIGELQQMALNAGFRR